MNMFCNGLDKNYSLHCFTELLLLITLFAVLAILSGCASGPPLISAASDDNISTVHDLLEQGTDVNVKDELDNTALMAAARSGNVEIVKLLIDKGADVNAINKYGETALISALKCRKAKTARLIINKGSKVPRIPSGKAILVLPNELDPLEFDDHTINIHPLGELVDQIIEGLSRGELEILELRERGWAIISPGDHRLRISYKSGYSRHKSISFPLDHKSVYRERKPISFPLDFCAKSGHIYSVNYEIIGHFWEGIIAWTDEYVVVDK